MKKIRFTSAGKLLQGLKSQYILKNNSLIDKLRIVLLPRSDYTRNFSFSNLATVVFASSINSWLIIDWFFSFCSTIQQRKQIFQNLQAPVSCQVYMQALFSCPQISRRSFGWEQNETVVLEIWLKCETYPDSPPRFHLNRHLKQSPKGPEYTFLYIINIFVQ